MVWFRPLAQLREQLPRPHPVGWWARSARVTEPCAPRWRGEGHGVLQQSRGCWRTVRGVQHSAPRTTTGGKESVTWRRFACENPDQGGKNRREHTKSVRRPLDTLLPIALHPTSLVGGREHFTDNDGGRVPRPLRVADASPRDRQTMPDIRRALGTSGRSRQPPDAEPPHHARSRTWPAHRTDPTCRHSRPESLGERRSPMTAREAPGFSRGEVRAVGKLFTHVVFFCKLMV